MLLSEIYAFSKMLSVVCLEGKMSPLMDSSEKQPFN